MSKNRDNWQRILGYWDSKRGTARAPRWRDLDPVLEIPRLLSRVFVVDIESDGGFRFRLLGSEIVMRGNRNATGRRFESLYRDDFLADVRQIYSEVANSGEPRLFRDWARAGDRRQSTTLLLPLLDDAGEIARILGFVEFSEEFVDDEFDWPVEIERVEIAAERAA
ncbi:PAS domain-containing protein [Roseiterribacter gracilis]|uniref:PAS domain-containing protein n=1 Tax=Roseiterribacter gracilis TaxID=2812848 RepID=UPI003B42D22C